MESEAPDRAGAGLAGRFFIGVLLVLLVVAVAWIVVGWILGWIFGFIRIALFVGLLVLAGWAFLRFKTRGD